MLKIWNASQICMSSLLRGHANLCIVPILVYVLPKRAPLPSFYIPYICVSILYWQGHPTPVLLLGKSHGWRSLVSCSPWGLQQSDRTEQLHFHFSLSCIEEGNGNPLQCSCLENPRDGGAWWAAVYGVAPSRTRLKRLSRSSSSSSSTPLCIGTTAGGRWEGRSGWGTSVYQWQIHVDVWQNQYNIVK